MCMYMCVCACVCVCMCVCVCVCIFMFVWMEQDWDGTIDLAKFQTMMLKTLRGLLAGDDSGQQVVREVI